MKKGWGTRECSRRREGANKPLGASRISADTISGSRTSAKIDFRASCETLAFQGLPNVKARAPIQFSVNQAVAEIPHRRFCIFRHTVVADLRWVSNDSPERACGGENIKSAVATFAGSLGDRPFSTAGSKACESFSVPDITIFLPVSRSRAFAAQKNAPIPTAGSNTSPQPPARR